MYTLRGRDLSDLVEGVEASLAARAESWAVGGSSDSGDEAPPPPPSPPPPPADAASGKRGPTCPAYAELVARACGTYHQSSPGGGACGSACSCSSSQLAPLPPSKPSPTQSRSVAAGRCRPIGQSGRPRVVDRPGGLSHSARPAPSSRPSSRLLDRLAEADDPLEAAPVGQAPLLPPAEAASTRANVDAATVEALRKQNRNLTERLHRQSQEVRRLQERLKLQEEAARQAQAQRPGVGQCSLPCCVPIARLEKAGLNVEPLCELDAKWAGYVFSLVSVQVKSSDLTFGEIFKKHRNSTGRLDEAAFRDFIRQFYPNVLEDRLTRLFYFADNDGSGYLNFLEFLRLFGCDLNGKMGEEYFEHVMVRIHRAVMKQGGLCSTFHLRDRHLHGTISRTRIIDVLLSLGIGLTRREAADLATRFDTGGGEVSLREFSNAMLMCASASFVTEEWVAKLFDQVVAALHKQSGSLGEALKSVSEKGWMDRGDLRDFLHKFNPNLRDGQIDRVFGFICAGCERLAGNQHDRVELGHFFRVVCQPRLGPALPHRQGAGLPAEVTEHLALQLSNICGNISRAFDLMNPCLCLEEFQASLQALGFAPGLDFEHLFSLLDVHRNGRIKRTTFIQVLEHQVQHRRSLTEGASAQQSKEDGAATKIQRIFRRRISETARRRSSVPALDANGGALSVCEVLEQRLSVARAMSGRRRSSSGADDVVSMALHMEVLNDQQRAINRILVLENDLALHRRQSEQGSDGCTRRGLVDQLRELESANRRLSQKLRELGEAPSGGEHWSTSCHDIEERRSAVSLSVTPHSERAPSKSRLTIDFDQASSSRHLVDATPRSSVVSQQDVHVPPDLVEAEEAHEPPEITEQEALEEGSRRSSQDSVAVEQLRGEVEALRKEKQHLQDQMSLEVEELQEQLYAAQGRNSPTSPRDTYRGEALVQATRSLSLSPSSPSRKSRRGGTMKISRSAAEKLRDAMHVYDIDRDAASFLQRTEGIALAGRFVVRDVLTVETDSLTLRCADSYMRRDVAVKIPTSNLPRARNEFLRECCIYSLLSEVPEVQNILHFPGMPEGFLFSVMELLQGRLLSEHLRSCRSGRMPALPPHEAAQICDAMLHGLEECHTHGAVHLDLKPSVIWEVQQPAGVMVKILDFGLARLTNLGLLAPDARHFFGHGPDGGGAVEEASSEPIFEVVSEEVEKVPSLAHGMAKWAAFAPHAQLAGVGSPWYMSPARLCGFALRYQRSVPQPELRWCETALASASAQQGGVCTLYVERGEVGAMDVAGVLQLPEVGESLQASRPAPHYPQGSYFEVVLRKVWPQHIIGVDVEKPNGPVGLAIGFTRTAPEGGDSWRNCSARDWPDSWVVGYDGRAFHNGVELWPSQDDEQEARLMNFKRKRAEVAEANGATRQCWPVGPLGWSLAELDRGDRLGVLAESGGHFMLYVNGILVWKIEMEGISGHEQLYPLVELCGLAREVALEPQPPGPPGTNRQELLALNTEQVDTLGLRAVSAFADMYAAAMIAQEVFLSDKPPEVPPSFVCLLTTIALWMRHGRPPVAHHGDLLLALTKWASVDRVRAGLDEGVAEVLSTVINRGLGEHRHGHLGAVRSVQDFRAMLNERTFCCHLAPEFLQSHLKLPSTTAQVRARSRWNFARTVVNPQRDDVVEGEVWDLSPWTLSASHVRRAVMVLQSKDGGHVGVVKVAQLEATVPLQLKLSLARCLRGSKKQEVGRTFESRGTILPHLPLHRRTSVDSRAKDPPRLQFGDALLPADECPVPFAQLQRMNVVDLVLRFVRRVDITRDALSAESEPIGVVGAALLAEALQRNPILEELNISGQAFGDEGAALLCAALRRDSQLLRLDFRSNGVGENGAKALAEALQDPKVTLRSLDLASNCLGSYGCCNLALMLRENSTLSSLGLQRNNIGVEGAVAIAEGLHYNYTLEELDLGRNTIGPSGAGALMRASRSSASLSSLNLQDNSLDVCAAAQMAQALQGVDAKGTALAVPSGGGSATTSWSGSSIQRLNLRHNLFGSKGAALLLGALKSSSRLSSLNFGWNDLGLEAAPAVAELLGSGSQCALQELDLRDSFLGEGAALGRALERMARMLLQDGSEDPDAASTVQATMRGSVRGSFRVPNGGLEGLFHAAEERHASPRKSLRRGGSNGSGLSGGTPPGTPTPGRRISLRAEVPEVADGTPSGPRRRSQEEVADGLPLSPRRRSRSKMSQEEVADGLPLSPRRRSRSQMSQEAARCPAHNLRHLNLGNSRLDPKGVALLAHAMPQFESLEVLLLYNNPALGTESRMVAVPVSLASKNGSSGVEAPISLEMVPGTAGVGAASLRELARSLTPALRRLSLGSCALGDTIAMEVLAALTGRLSFEELDLSDNGLGGNAESSNRNVEESTALGGRLCKPLCDFMGGCPHLLKLGLGLNGFGDTCIVELLRTMCGITHDLVVDLAANRVSDELRATLDGRNVSTPSPGSPSGQAAMLLAATTPSPRARLHV